MASMTSDLESGGLPPPSEAADARFAAAGTAEVRGTVESGGA